MNVKLLSFGFAFCLVGLGNIVSSARADDAASNAVKQCFLNMQSVHSYRTKTVTITPGFDAADQDVVTEETQAPPRTHVVTTITAVKYEHEVVMADNVIYIRVNEGSWRAQTFAIPASVPWGASWGKEYDPHTTYVFKRKDTLDTIPVDVYSTAGIVEGQQTNTEIWIGTKDHLPHEILKHSVQGDKTEHYITETLSDFNAPITITVPNVASSDPPPDQAQPNDNH